MSKMLSCEMLHCLFVRFEKKRILVKYEVDV